MLIKSIRMAIVACLVAAPLGCSKSDKSDADGAANSGPTREQAVTSGKNVGTLCSAALNYESANKAYPPRFLKAKDGQPGLSWRVALLPYLGEENLYAQFKLDESWDSPANKPLIAKMPAVYKSPLANVKAGFTNYLAVATPKSAIADDPVRIAAIVDGTAHTALIVEVNDDRAVEWTRPADYAPDSAQPLAGLGGLHPQGAFIMGMSSSDVHFFKSSMNPQAFAALCSRDDGELVDGPAINADPYPQPKETTPAGAK